MVGIAQSEDVFLQQRKQVLAAWPTGAAVDLADAVAFHKTLPDSQHVAWVRANAKSTGHVLLQPLAGVPALDRHIELLQHLQDAGGADIVPTQIDSQTRNLHFQLAEQALRESERTGEDKLNGFPIVNHGVDATRKLVSSLRIPIEMRIGAVDPRLAAEIAFAGGISSMTAGPIYYTVHYSRDMSFGEAIELWRHVFRLVGWYRERGVTLGLQIHGVGNATAFPNTLLAVCCALECLLAAEQGARNFSVDTRFMGSMLQDVAAAHVVPEMCHKFLAEFGYDDVVITIDRKSWGGRYPEDEAAAYGLTCYDAVTGMVAGVNEFITKSVQEGVGIPLKEANSATLRAMRQIIGLMRTQHVPLDPAALELERHMMRLEIEALFRAVLDLGGGDPALGIVRSFEAGVLDVPFAATRNCKGLVMVARDDTGAVRYVDSGALPIPNEVLEYHKQCLARRAGPEGLRYRDIVDDIFSISRGYLVAS